VADSSRVRGTPRDRHDVVRGKAGRFVDQQETISLRQDDSP
jgi:hypothetical protein